jgi:hypothetical protein
MSFILVRWESNKAVNTDAFYARFAHYKCAGYDWRYVQDK